MRCNRCKRGEHCSNPYCERWRPSRDDADAARRMMYLAARQQGKTEALRQMMGRQIAGAGRSLDLQTLINDQATARRDMERMMVQLKQATLGGMMYVDQARQVLFQRPMMPLPPLPSLEERTGIPHKKRRRKTA